MEYLIIISTLTLPFLIGFYSTHKSRESIDKNLAFIDEFHENLRDYCESRGQDREAYEWMLKKTLRIQRLYNWTGMSYRYEDHALGRAIDRYQIFSNEIPKLRKCFDDFNHVTNDMARASYNLIYETLTRMTGILEHRLESDYYDQGIIPSYTKGVGLILQSPLTLLEKFGLISASSIRKVSRNKGFDVVTRITALLGLIYAVMEIFIDWPEFMQRILP